MNKKTKKRDQTGNGEKKTKLRPEVSYKCGSELGNNQ